ncbi:hypothetical protein CAP36_01505 [Chitinophagaceae bacterium IBVUCB2]|nr:hypothetical protein CAP36_01505 [Chitinophagaceae bacterium IBVUCB2]
MFIPKRQWLLLALTYFITIAVNSQPRKTATTEQEILKIYEAQLKSVYQARGMSDNEIEKYLAGGKEGTATLTDFSFELRQLYSYTMAPKLAVLFYLFNKDTLYRYFITPGAILEKKKIAIKKAVLEKLNIDVYNSLDIYRQSTSRAPRIRGLKPTVKKPPGGISFEEAIQKATSILLPESFDERYEHLIVIPAFSIGAFPFQLLQPYKDSSYLIDKCSFSIAPSLLDLVAIRKRMINKLKETSGVNLVEYEKIPFTLEKPLFISNPSYPVTNKYFFPDLPGAKKEIAGNIPFAKEYTLLEGKNATKANVLNKIRHADVAYFATHGMSSDINPLDNNLLVLAGEKDPFLTARNIMSLRDTNYTDQYSFPKLIVLSACQTGLGKSMEAGITAGLARSFLVAGANQVIMSLWNVDDNATAYLMNRFIFHLQNNNSYCPSEPLRLAQLETRKKFKHPSQWASFSVFGVNY